MEIHKYIIASPYIFRQADECDALQQDTVASRQTLNSQVYSSDTTVAFTSLANETKCNGPVMSLHHGDTTPPPISQHRYHRKQVAAVYWDHRMAGTMHG